MMDITQTNKHGYGLFKIVHSETFWVSGTSLLNALSEYLTTSCIELADMDNPDDSIIQVPKSEWPSIVIRMVDDEEPDIFKTMAEIMEDQQYSDILASSEEI